MNNINALKMLIMTLYDFYSNDTFIVNGKISISSTLYGSLKHAFDTYHSSDEERTRYDTKVTEFYDGIGINEDELVQRESMKVYFEPGFKYRGETLINSDFGFGEYATIKEDTSKEEESCYVEFNPKYLNSKYHNGTVLTDEAATANTGVNESGKDNHVDTNNLNDEDKRENGKAEAHKNEVDAIINDDTKLNNKILFGIAIIGFYISIVTFIQGRKKL